MNRHLPNLIKQVFLLITLAGLSLSAYSQEKSVDLDEVVIASTKLNITKVEADHQITIITEEQIRSYPNSSIDELLKYVSGVEVLSRGVMGTQSDISIRGGTFNQVLVLLDGVRVNDPLTGHFNSYIPIATAEISRIEIIKGSASGVYGSDAVGGIIHVISKTYAKVHGEKSADYLGESWYGDYALSRSSAGGIYEREKWAIGGGGNLTIADGHIPEGEVNGSTFLLGTYSLAAAFTPNEKLSINLRSALDVRLFDAKYFYTVSSADQSVEAIGRQFNIGSVRYKHSDDQETVFNVGFQATRDSFLFNSMVEGNYHRTNHRDFNLYHITKATPTTTLTIGTQFLGRNIKSNDRGDHNTKNLGIYWLANQKVGEMININGGLRLDHDPAFNWEVSPQIGVNIKPISKLSIRGFAGKSIRAADFTERFVSTNSAGPLSAGRNLGNPNLAAEKAWNYELGLDWTLMPALSVNVTGFYRQGSDIIDYIITPASEIKNATNLDESSEYFYASNFAKLNTSGAELSINYRKEFTNAHIAVNAGAMVLDFASPNTSVVSKYIANNAGLLTNLSARWHHKYYSVAINGIFKSRDADKADLINKELAKSYYLLNGRVDIHPIKFPITLSVMVSNILDQEYSDILGPGLPGRWIQVGSSYRFQR